MGLVRHEICETWVKISFLLCNALKNVEAIMVYLLYIFADNKKKPCRSHQKKKKKNLVDLLSRMRDNVFH